MALADLVASSPQHPQTGKARRRTGQRDLLGDLDRHAEIEADQEQDDQAAVEGVEPLRLEALRPGRVAHDAISDRIWRPRLAQSKRSRQAAKARSCRRFSRSMSSMLSSTPRARASWSG